MLLLRFTAGYSLIGVEHVTSGNGDVAALLLRCAAMLVAVLLLLGLGTPFAAVGEALIQVGIMTVVKRYDSSAMVAATLGLGLAMLGPGAWSLDARVFGRKRIV